MFARVFILALCSRAVFAAEQPLPPASAQKTLDDMRTKLSAVKTLEVDVKQRRVLKIFSDELTSTGKLYVAVPHKIRWETLTPYHSLLVFNENDAAKFEQKDQQWKKLSFGGSGILAEVMSQIMKWNQGDFSTANNTYDLTVYQGPRIELSPKPEAQKKLLDKIELYPDPLTMRIKKTILREGKGDYIELSFSNYQENKALPDKLFDLEKPQ